MPTDKLIEAVRDALYESGAPYARGVIATEENARAAILATLKGIREPSEGVMREFTACHLREGQNADELVPLAGTGQGDLQMVPAWEDSWYCLAMTDRWQAMIDQLISELQ